MTLFNIMINVSRNGIKAIMKNDPIKYLQKTRRKCGLIETTCFLPNKETLVTMNNEYTSFIHSP